MMFNMVGVIATLFASTAALRDAAADKVESLDAFPGWPAQASFDIYSGFINVPDTSKEIHYILLESKKDPSKDPLVVWFNGGPGCSSMLGFLQETGPYVLQDGDTTYTENTYAWNNETNILYIEQPAGVGYSTCDNLTRPQDCVHTDNSSAHDNLQVLLGFFDRFKDKNYRTNPVYIAGESYAGIYVPLLSYFVNEFNQNATEAEKINLQGFMVGNGVTNWTYDTVPARYDVAYYRYLISQQLRDQIDNQNCNFSGLGQGDYSHLTEECGKLLSKMYDSFDGVDIYNIYGKCWNWSAETTNFTSTQIREKLFGKHIVNGVEHEYQKFYSAEEYTPWVKNPFKKENDAANNDTNYGIPGCIYALPAAEHLNWKTVRDQLHITNDQTWRMCSVRGMSTFQYTKDSAASQWAYEALRKSGVRMMHFSGDKDGSVPTIGTERWINNMGWNISQDWSYYLMPNDQIGGYYQIFEEDFTFITVHGAGHMVPQDEREIAYHILFDWLFRRGEFFDPPSDEQTQFIQS